MTRFSRAAGRIMVAVASLTSLLILNAPAATATPIIGDIWCESGARKFICRADVSNTVGTVTGRWELYRFGVYLGSLGGTYGTGMRSCTPGGDYRIEYYVTDATGTAHASTSVSCSGDPWQ
jgi:hypothetical protein